MNPHISKPLSSQKYIANSAHAVRDHAPGAVPDNKRKVSKMIKNHLMKLFSAITLCAACILAPSAYANIELIVDLETNTLAQSQAVWLTVDRVGMSPGYGWVRLKNNTGGLVLAAPGQTPCLYNIFYVDVSQPYGRLTYQMLFLARNTGKRISRLVYVQNADFQCFINMVQQSE